VKTKINNLLFRIKQQTYKITREAIRRILQISIRSVDFLYKLWAYFKRLVSGFSNIAISFLSSLLAIFLLLPSSQARINCYNNMDTIFIAIGGTLITILVLAFTLAIIPIQRAVESFSPSISYLYRNDNVTKLIFILISLFALVSFVLSIDSIIVGTKASVLLPIDLFVVGVSLDLLRLHHRRICLLLEPSIAIQKLSKLIINYIRTNQRRISRYAKLGFYTLPESEKEGKNPTSLESALYLSNPDHKKFLSQNIGEIAEIANKALAKNEIHTANTAISSLANVCIHYIESRKNNLVLYPSRDALYLINQSDIDSLLNKIYQNLSDVAQNAIRASDQTSCTYVLKAFGKIAVFISNLEFGGNRNRYKNLLFAPVSFLGDLMEKAQAQELDEVVLQGCYILDDLTFRSPDDFHFIEVDLSNSKLYFRIIRNYFISGRLDFINKVLESMLTRLHILLEKHPRSLFHILKSSLETIEHLMPLALVREKQSNLNFMFLPFSMPYQITNDKSLAAFVQQATLLNRVDEEREFANPYSHFSEYNHQIAWHFRKLAENCDFGYSAFLWYIIESIKSIMIVYLKILESPLTNIQNHLDDLVKDMTLYMSFFWVAFSKSTKIKHYYAMEACDALTWIALYCYSEKISQENSFILLKMKIVDSCVSNIASIIDSYTEVGEDRNFYNITDLIMHLWYIRLLALKRNEIYQVKNIDSKIGKLKAYEKGDWTEIEEIFELRHRQLIKELFENSRMRALDQNKAIGLLRYFLTEKEFLEHQSPRNIKSEKNVKGK